MSDPIRPSLPVGETPKQPYAKPVLMRHGTVAELTQGTSGFMDSDASSNVP